jgi:protein JSN1
MKTTALFPESLVKRPLLHPRPPMPNGEFPRHAILGITQSSLSIVFWHRARELQAEERLAGGRYRPPALRALSSTSGAPPTNDIPTTTTTPGDGSALPPHNYPPGFRRARAGTLPSNVHLAAQRLATSSSTPNTLPADVFPEQSQRQPNVPVSATLATAPSRPGLRHSNSVASSAGSSVVTERNSRLRSGSLTLPAAGLSNAFGPSIFSSSWLTSGNGSGGTFPVLDELRSVTSADSGADEFDVHTLDYLGLDDSHRPPPAATISELRHQAQAAITGNLAPSRMRATTVSNPYRSRPQVASSLLSSTNTDEDDSYFDSYDNQTTSYGQHLSSYEGADDNYLASSYGPKVFSANEHLAGNIVSRPRAISVGILDDPARSLQRRTAAAAELQQSSYLADNSAQSSGLAGVSGIAGPAGILKTDKSLGTRSASSPNVHFPNGELGGNRGYLTTPASGNRAVSPKSENTSQTQTPTRSLWIGNLDSAVTSEQLIHVFAPYGAIESLRLLPEKVRLVICLLSSSASSFASQECGFVNFVDQADAIRAKDDVLNRLGGNIGMPNGQAVRIGFGKADSAPVAPAKGTPAPNSGGSTSPSGLSGKAAAGGANANLNGMDAQLQSSPTRALWIGSIPSTTTPATILNVFSPYGPIESARVLTHKNCGFSQFSRFLSLLTCDVYLSPVNFERLDDAVRARKALNSRDVLGSDVGAIRIGFAKVPVKTGQDGMNNGEENNPSVNVQGVGDLSVGATIHALRSVKGATAVHAEQQVLGGCVENYRSNLLLSMIAAGGHSPASFVADGTAKPPGWLPSITEQQMIMKELSAGSPDADADIQALAGERRQASVFISMRVHLVWQNSGHLRCITHQYPLFLRGPTIEGGTRPSCGSCGRGWIREL